MPVSTRSTDLQDGRVWSLRDASVRERSVLCPMGCGSLFDARKDREKETLNMEQKEAKIKCNPFGRNWV